MEDQKNLEGNDSGVELKAIRKLVIAHARKVYLAYAAMILIVLGVVTFEAISWYGDVQTAKMAAQVAAQVKTNGAIISSSHDAIKALEKELTSMKMMNIQQQHLLVATHREFLTSKTCEIHHSDSTKQWLMELMKDDKLVKK